MMIVDISGWNVRTHPGWLTATTKTAKFQRGTDLVFVRVNIVIIIIVGVVAGKECFSIHPSILPAFVFLQP